jgi:hypothetical protein
MARYLAVQAVNEPHDIGPDEADPEKRPRVVFDVLAMMRPSATFVEELLSVLEAAEVGVQGTTLFGSSQATWPAGAGPFLMIRATPGAAPIGIHNLGAAALRRPGARVQVRASTVAAAMAMAQAAYTALVALRNRDVELPA